MHKQHNSILAALLLASSFEASALQINGNPASTHPIAKNDYISTVAGVYVTAEGELSGNDLFGTTYSLDVSWVGQYGLITKFSSEGKFTYELFDSTSNDTLPSSGVGTDRFKYTYTNDTGLKDTAFLVIDVHANPATFHPETGGDQPYDNVDIEFNDRSAQATPLNSARNIKGHLYNSGDKDWYSLASAGNETITLEVCPKGTSCFGQKSWVLYVFDSNLLTRQMEESTFPFGRFNKDTGEFLGSNGESNHLYLGYNVGFFDGALIGVVDPCFGDRNTVDIGVGDGPRNYLVAISSPLKGDGSDEVCGQGSIVLERDINANTVGEFISSFPNSDDQYSIKITGTGRHPLLSETAAANSAAYSSRSGSLYIPSIRVDHLIYKVILDEQTPTGPGAHSLLNGTKFNLSDISLLTPNEDTVDAFRATYNPENQEVMIPRITDTESGLAYSVTLQFYAASGDNKPWLEVIKVISITEPQ